MAENARERNQFTLRLDADLREKLDKRVAESKKKRGRGWSLTQEIEEALRPHLGLPPRSEEITIGVKKLIPLLAAMESRQPAVLGFFERELRRLLKELQ